MLPGSVDLPFQKKSNFFHFFSFFLSKTYGLRAITVSGVDDT